ncbi:MAG: aldehyde dehydrogenase [Bacteroidota bacterium]
MIRIANLINGQLVPPVTGEYLDNINPATGEIYSLIPDSGKEDVDRATDAAKAAFPAWSNLSKEKRSERLLELARLIELNLDRLALAETNDQGKPLWLSRSVDIPRAVSNFRFYATASLHTHTEAHSMENIALNYTLRTPVGVAGCISPWNLPLYLFTWKIAPALAAGCTVVAKPSEITPMTAFILSELSLQAGFPKGVLNIVHGLGPKVGMPIVEHRDIPAVSFTGGTKTGEVISRTAAPMFKKLSLELGGKNPTIVFADCDFEKTVQTAVRSAFSNQGEICLCGSRIYIERSIYERFKEDFIKAVKALNTGDPLAEENWLGAIASKQHFDKILSYIELAKQEGGRLLCGGHAIKPEGRCSNGFFIAPTVFEGLSSECRTNQEEIFGPVVTLQPFDTEEEVLSMANGTSYGLATSLWTENLTRAHRMAGRLDFGIVWINCWLLRDLRTPFGGMKGSGVGREGGFEAIEFFTEEKNVCIRL